MDKDSWYDKDNPGKNAKAFADMVDEMILIQANAYNKWYRDNVMNKK